MSGRADERAVARREVLAGLCATVGLAATTGRATARDRGAAEPTSEWELVLDGAENDEIRAAAGSPDDGYLLGGEFATDDFYPLLVLVDDDGNKRWVQEPDDPGSVWDVAVAPTGGFVAGGYRSEDLDTYPWLAKYRTGGTVAWEWTGDEEGKVTAVERAGDGVVAAGSGSLVDSPGWLARVDDGGTVDVFAETPWTSAFVADDAGVTLVSNQYDDESETEYLQLVRIDEDGTERWRRTYEEDASIRARAAVGTDQGTTVVGRWDGESTDGLAVSLPADGDPDWRRTYSADGTVSIADVAPAGRGFVVTGGRVAKSWVALLDEEGTVLSEATYVNDVTGYIASGTAVVPAGEGSYVLVEHLNHPFADDDEDDSDARVRKLSFESVPTDVSPTPTSEPASTGNDGSSSGDDGSTPGSDDGNDEAPRTETTAVEAGSWLPVVGAGGVLAALGAASARRRSGDDE